LCPFHRTTLIQGHWCFEICNNFLTLGQNWCPLVLRSMWYNMKSVIPDATSLSLLCLLRLVPSHLLPVNFVLCFGWSSSLSLILTVLSPIPFGGMGIDGYFPAHQCVYVRLELDNPPP
jgi:hypothetical protein